jgi:hypothetical protein
MSEPPLHLLEDLASLDEQRRYIVHATKDEYLLPEELLGNAIQFCNLVRRPEVWLTLTTNQQQAVLAMEEAANGADLNRYSRANITDLIEREPTWISVRKEAMRTLNAFCAHVPN